MTAVIVPYEGQVFFDLDIAGLRRRLPLIQVSPDTWIAYFDSLGDLEFISHCAKRLAEVLSDCEVLVTSETKGVSLAHEIAKILGHRYYIVCRKGVKSFMRDPIVVEYRPVTSSERLKLSIDGRQAEKIRNRRVGIVDDIVSTRETFRAIEEIVTLAGGKVVKKAVILAEGEVPHDIYHLGVLPLFKRR
ncbi:MAG: phosphoribosyltransferase family protein [Aigarchaeota archaeon]|nr:phosphoribosyltransferase family protein [Aigarchaeota archaeon]MDW8092639.1 phosphoribosyltransferase family protein [Nitrososphaerota archaeon]